VSLIINVVHLEDVVYHNYQESVEGWTKLNQVEWSMVYCNHWNETSMHSVTSPICSRNRLCHEECIGWFRCESDVDITSSYTFTFRVDKRPTPRP